MASSADAGTSVAARADARASTADDALDAGWNKDRSAEPFTNQPANGSAGAREFRERVRVNERVRVSVARLHDMGFTPSQSFQVPTCGTGTKVLALLVQKFLLAGTKVQTLTP